MISKRNIILGAATALVILGAAAYGITRFLGSKTNSETPTPSGSTVAQTTPSAPAGLGAQLYNQAQNPIQNKLPETNPEVNPLQGIYKNPFQ